MLAWPFCKLQRVHQLLGKLFPWVIELLWGVLANMFGVRSYKAGGEMTISWFPYLTHFCYLGLSTVSHDKYYWEIWKNSAGKSSTSQYVAPVGLYSLWDCLESVVEVVAILKTLHQDLIGGFQNNDLAEIQNLKIAEFWAFSNLIPYSGLPNLSSQILACSTLAGKPSTKKPLHSGCFAIASKSRSVTSSCQNHNHLSVDLNLEGFIHVLNHPEMSV